MHVVNKIENGHVSSSNTNKRARNIDNLYQLLKNRVFYKTDYASWLFECIVNVTVPIHPKFAALIKEYVYCVFLENRIEKIPESWIQPYLNDIYLLTPTHILLTLYMLQFNDAIIAFRTDPKYVALLSNIMTPGQHVPYSILDVVQTVPLQAMLNHIETQNNNNTKKSIPYYQSIYPDMISLTANLFPELLDAVSFLLTTEKEYITNHYYYYSQHHKNEIDLDILSSELLSYKDQPNITLKALARLHSVELKNMHDCVKKLVGLLLLPCLEKDIDSQIIDGFISAWKYFHQSIPHQLWLCTINTLIPKKSTDFTFDDLIKSPTILFRCDKRIFRSKRLLPLWLHILSCLRTCSKHRIWQRFHSQFNRNDSRINGRNVMALINAQESVMLQSLLELCHQQREDEDNENLLMDARYLICSFIHGVFIDDRDSLLAKTLHFQTYPIDLIPMMVELIPSMYIVSNFLPELIRQPQIEKQVFGIILACHLCEKYPMESYLALAEKCAMTRLLKIAYPIQPQPPQQQPSSKTGSDTQCVPSEYLIQAIPALVHLARAFPFYSPHILKALDDIRQGLPTMPNTLLGEEKSHTRIILILQLHKVLKDTRDLVQKEFEHMDQVNKPVDLDL